MKFTDIKSMTYIGNNVSIDGRDIEISTPLKEDITAVQFHKGRDFCIEEPLMKEVPLTKYQFILDEFEKQRDILDTPKEKTLQDLKDEKLTDIKSTYETESTKNIIYKNVLYKGGDSSASAIAGSITLAQSLQESNVKIIGADDSANEMSFAEALELSGLIAKEWRTAFFRYKELKLQISNAATVEELDLISWEEV